MSSLTFVGLGLYDEKDISLKGLEAVKNSDLIFAEFYTSFLAGTNKGKLEKLFSKEIKILERSDVEEKDIILDEAKKKNVVFLTAGDSLTATTHIELRLRAIDWGIKTRIIHGISIFTAVSGLLGLQAYKFGKTTTIPFPEKNYTPTSFYDVIEQNNQIGLHTLVLLDIKKEKYMSANEGIKILLEIEEKKQKKLITQDTIICVVARAGSDDSLIEAGLAGNLVNQDFGDPMHSIVIPSTLHFMEKEALNKICKSSIIL